MTIIPADRTTAAWNVHHTLDNLLGWARYPDTEPLTNDWASEQRQTVVRVTDNAILSFAGDEVTIQSLKSVRKLAHEFIALMLDRPRLSTTPREEWTVPSDCQLFDDLAVIAREFRALSNATSAKGAAVRPVVETTTVAKHVEHLEHTKIKLPTNPDVAEVWNAVQAVPEGTANISEICRSIAEKRGCNAESLRTQFGRWKRNNVG